MPTDKSLAIILIVIALALLSFTLFVNLANPFQNLSSNVSPQGLGRLCPNLETCKDYCQNNRGRCLDLCNINPHLEICKALALS